MILSIIIISHNQKEQFCRCIESVLAQDLPYDFEIIVSDDASNDGTWELILDYESRYPDIVKAYQCNSDDCSPANNSQRSGWNRCNAYSHAEGKYIAHVDADDFFMPNATVYTKQIEALEKNPDCSLAVSNVLWYSEGEPIETAYPWLSSSLFGQDTIMTGSQFILDRLFVINQAMMMRRNSDIDPVAIYGKRYVDSVITYHHLQFGNVVFVDACDYVYVQSKQSITSNVAKTQDRMVLWCNGIYISELVPAWRHDFYLADYHAIRDVVSLARAGYKLQEQSKRSLDGIDIFIYNAFNRPLSIFDKTRLFLITTFLRAMHKFNWDKRVDTDILHFLLCR